MEKGPVCTFQWHGYVEKESALLHVLLLLLPSTFQRPPPRRGFVSVYCPVPLDPCPQSKADYIPIVPECVEPTVNARAIMTTSQPNPPIPTMHTRVDDMDPSE